MHRIHLMNVLNIALERSLKPWQERIKKRQKLCNLSGGQPVRCAAYQEQDVQREAPEPEEISDDDKNHPVEENIEGYIAKLAGREKKFILVETKDG
ncbi:hypothetical protein CRYUN_Cryun06bG0027700 [Craigia yunnanensis]